MSTNTDNEMAANSVVGKQFVSIAEYRLLLSRASMMERKLKALENIQDLLRQKDVELRKCRSMIHQYQMALRKSEYRQIDSMHTIAKICEVKDRYGKDQTYEIDPESNQNKGFCLLYTDVNGRSSERPDETAVACDVVDVDSVQSKPYSVSIVSATSSNSDSNCSKSSNEEDVIMAGTELQDSSGTVAVTPQKFQRETGTIFTEDSCGQVTNHRDEMKMESIPRSACLHLKSNQKRTDQRQSFQSPLASSLSKDLLTKLMQQNARLKKVLRDILSCRGASVEEYIDTEELKDTIIQLRQRLAESTNQMAELETKIRTYEDMEQKQGSELIQDDGLTAKKGGTELSSYYTQKFPSKEPGRQHST